MFGHRPASDAHIRQDGHQPELGAEFRIDQKVIATQPAESGQLTHLFMGHVGLLMIPIYDLRSGHGERPVSLVLDESRGKKSGAIQQKVDLTVMVHVKRRGAVPEIIKDGWQEPLAERDGQMEPVLEAGLKKELVSDAGDVRDAEKVDAQRPDKGPQTLFTIIIFRHGPIVVTPQRSVNAVDSKR